MMEKGCAHLKLLIVIVFISLNVFAQKKPNILWIITDDQRADAIECYNQAVSGVSNSPLGYVESPNIDALAKEGVLFTNAFCNSPGCAPSRGSMHTGMYPWHSGIYGFEKSHTSASHYKGSIPEVMKDNGYKTTNFGKSGLYIFKWIGKPSYTRTDVYDLSITDNTIRKTGLSDWTSEKVRKNGGIAASKEVWTHPDGSKTEFVTTTEGEISKEDITVKEAFDKKYEILRCYTKLNGKTSIIGGESPQPGHLTQDGRIHEVFERYLSNPNTTYTTIEGKTVNGPDTNQPQFINLGYHFPHTPVTPPKAFRDKFKDKVYKIPEFSSKELKTLPKNLQLWYKKAAVDKMTYQEKQQFIRDYYAFCAFGDEMIGKSIKTFKKYCEDNNQEYLILLAAGDHGWHLGEQGGANKFGPYKASNSTAVVVVSSDKKRFPEGKVVNEFIEYVDFAPTFYNTIGVNTKQENFKHLDGYDLGEVVKGNVPKRAYTIGAINHGVGEISFIRSKAFSFSMRTKKDNAKPKKGKLLKDIKWPLTTSREQAEMALFDLRVDPGEQNNVANNPKYKKLADWFRTKLGTIVLGDRRVNCDWNYENEWAISNFAEGSDDKKLEIPLELIP
ncbi:sulfatase-like hydrolase/transferase [Seonamhaeicola marinus]|uniref:Sulfatase-like hydrolase/transferase n=1 Tax=Seonamhaeicola marinus TaxID=1912246 RepID=A0A5D0HYR4_9FLAO|nr:sulfatase-like hydrolase/transferase [Seonamhaeicola marinus]TYA74632.1 sulfatase-like hydrolase/transferase [Seonamhaeicola marinus]